MSVEYEVAQYLANSGFGVLGTSIFVDQIPAETNGIFVVSSGGQPNKYIPVTESIVDIYSKDTSASDAITLLESIKNHIHRMHTTETSNAYFFRFLVIGDVEPVQRDEEYAKIYKISVQIFNRAKNLIS